MSGLYFRYYPELRLTTQSDTQGEEWCAHLERPTAVSVTQTSFTPGGNNRSRRGRERTQRSFRRTFLRHSIFSAQRSQRPPTFTVSSIFCVFFEFLLCLNAYLFWCAWPLDLRGSWPTALGLIRRARALLASTAGSTRLMFVYSLPLCSGGRTPGWSFASDRRSGRQKTGATLDGIRSTQP